MKIDKKLKIIECGCKNRPSDFVIRFGEYSLLPCVACWRNMEHAALKELLSHMKITIINK